MPDIKFQMPVYKRFLAAIDDHDGISMSRLAWTTNVTYSHTAKLLEVMRKAGMVTNEWKGRERQMHITEKGRLLADLYRRELELIPEAMRR